MKIAPEHPQGKAMLKISAEGGQWIKVDGQELFAPSLYTTAGTSLESLSLSETAPPPMVVAEVWTADQVTAKAIEIAESKATDPGGKWEVGQFVLAGYVRTYAGIKYTCIQTHTTQADWIPPLVPALWEEVKAPGVITDWRQPTGAHDAYKQGDQVKHKNRTWVSDADGNVWEPGVYGWTEVK